MTALPGGLTTRVQTQINRAIQEEIFADPSLKACVVARLEALVEEAPLDPSQQDALIEGLDRIVRDALSQLMLTRTASADITNTLLSTAAGALAFKKFTPGGFGIGLLLAAIWVQEQARRDFFLGDTLGGWYYHVFPPKPDAFEQAVGIALVMMLLSVVASFSGLLTDPFQAHTRLHQFRLRRMLNRMERDLIQKSASSFKPIDPYIARILELFDTLKAQISF